MQCMNQWSSGHVGSKGLEMPCLNTGMSFTAHPRLRLTNEIANIYSPKVSQDKLSTPKRTLH